MVVSPFDPNKMDGTIVKVENNKVTELILGKWQDPAIDYSGFFKTVNIYYFSKRILQAYIPMIEWYVNNLNKNNYYEKVLGSLIYLREFDIKPVIVPDSSWCEIDTLYDLHAAEQRIHQYF